MTAALAALMRRIHGMTTEPMVLRFGCKATSDTDIAAAEAWSGSCNLKSAQAAKTELLFNFLSCSSRSTI